MTPEAAYIHTYIHTYGLKIKWNKAQNTTIKIHKNAKFKNSTINITGKNNSINLGSGKYKNCKITCYSGDNQHLKIGNNFSCHGVEFHLKEENSSITIGDNCMFSYGIDIWPTDGHALIEINNPTRAFNLSKPIIIKNHVWLGQNTKILKGVVIPDNSIVGISSVVIKQFNERNTIIAGNPAKVIKHNISWDKQTAYKFNKKTPQ